MMCQNCGKSEVTFRYTQVINGVKKEMNLCDNCARELGLKDMNFSMPINFSSFLSDFFNDSLLPSFVGTQTLQCNNCKTTFDDFVNSGEFGCSSCYDLFEDRIEPILRNLQGSTRHVGRGYREITPSTVKNTAKKKVEKKEENELDKLQKDLQKAIKEERYEDAAKIRDEIKKLEKNKNNKKDE